MAITWGSKVYGPSGSSRDGYRLGYEILNNNSSTVTLKIYVETRWSVQDTRFNLSVNVNNSNVVDEKVSIYTYRNSTSWSDETGNTQNVIELKSCNVTTPGTFSFSAALSCTATNTNAILYGATCYCSGSGTVYSPPVSTGTPVITGYTAKQDGKSGIHVYIATSNAYSVHVPNWTDANGQDDLATHWPLATQQTNVIDGVTYNWYYHISFSDHNNEMGTYIIHMYAFDNIGTTSVNAGQTFTPVTTYPTVNNVAIVQKNSSGFYVYVNATNADDIRVPVWTAPGNTPELDVIHQDDLIWHVAVKETNVIDGISYEWRAWIPVSEHNNEYGLYQVHVYAYNGWGKAPEETKNVAYIAKNPCNNPTGCVIDLYESNADYLYYDFTCPEEVDYFARFDWIEVYIGSSTTLSSNTVSNWTNIGPINKSDLDENLKYHGEISKDVFTINPGEYVFIKLRAIATNWGYAYSMNSNEVITSKYYESGNEVSTTNCKFNNKFVGGTVHKKGNDNNWKVVVFTLPNINKTVDENGATIVDVNGNYLYTINNKAKEVI